jgi:catechol 2,3-dioxygenase-like lactoylglutathione lyase family enzyme
MIEELHHIQIAMPIGKEDDARDFYSDVLGFSEVEKPDELSGRGGVWFQSQNVRLHLGVEEPFAPAKKAHPGFRVGSLKNSVALLEAARIEFRPDIDLPGIKRIYVSDPFGNRIELLEVTTT